jgi:cell division protein FtsB
MFWKSFIFKPFELDGMEFTEDEVKTIFENYADELIKAKKEVQELKKENEKLKQENKDLWEDLDDMKDHLVDILNDRYETVKVLEKVKDYVNEMYEKSKL